MSLLWAVAYVLDMLDLETLPAHYDSSLQHNCRAYNTVFDQGECGSCLAFAVATAYGMNRCVTGQDELPSPHRIFDCSGRTCEQGMNLFILRRVLQNGVPDVNSTPPLYGMGCTEGPYKASLQLFFGKQSIKRALMSQGALLHQLEIEHQQETEAHAVVVIGWGSQPEPHWIIHNSWSQRWGSNGRAITPMNAVELMIGISTDPFSWL